MAFGGTYSTGTIAITADATALVGTGTLWSAVVDEGDWFYANGAFGLISSVTNDTNIVLDLPWKGGTLSGATYRIVKMSWLRYEPALTQQKLRSFLAVLTDASIYYQVTGSAPDVGLGENGQYALKVNGGPWTLWLKVAGVWELQGTPIGFSWKGAWSGATAYVIGDGVSRIGKTYIAILAGTNHAPESSPTYWSLLTSGGDVYDVGGFSPDRPGSGENILSWKFNRTVTFYAGLTDSVASSGTPAQSDAVFAIQKTGTAPPATVAVTIAAPGVVTHTAHGRSNGDRVSFATTGVLPTGISARRWYFIVNKTADTYQISTSSGGTAINTSDSQSGVHTASYGVEFGSITIAAGSTTGAFTSSQDAVFVKNEILDVIGPWPRDPTLSDMHVTLFGFRG